MNASTDVYASLEAKLKAYRRRKRQQEFFLKIKNKIIGMIPFLGNNADKKKEDDCVVQITENDVPVRTKQIIHKTVPKLVESDGSFEYLNEEDDDDDDDDSAIEIESRKSEKNSCLRYALWIIYFLFWATCYAIAIELKFGVVYLMFSAIIGIYLNTRTGPKRKNEISAYSVFNKNCESIDGTLKAEQFEREIRYGPTSVR